MNLKKTEPLPLKYAELPQFLDDTAKPQQRSSRIEKTTPLPSPMAPRNANAVTAWSHHPNPFFDPHGAHKGNAKIINPDEVAWLQEQLTKAKTEGLAQAEAVALEPVSRLVGWAVSQIKYEEQSGGWPHSEQEVWTRKTGDCSDFAFIIAMNLLRNGYRDVGIRKGVPKNYRPKQPGHAWVTATIEGEEYIIDASSTAAVHKAHVSPLRDYFVVSTILPEDLPKSVSTDR